MKNKNILIILFSIVFLTFLVFILAASGIPTALTFGQNTTSNYDEGTFAVNWTKGAGDDISNYSIYISNDSGSTWFKKGVNDSETGYSYTNNTEGNYSFQIAGVNETDDEGTNSSIIYMNIDTTAPAVPTALTFALNTTTTYDNDGNFSVNWTAGGDLESNYSIYISVGGVLFKKATNDSATGFLFVNATEGNYTFQVAGVDLLDREGTNTTSALYMNIDNTAPTLSFGCTSETVVLYGTVTCACSGTDATSGFNTSSLSYTASPSTSTIGTHTETCTGTDYAGNSVSASTTYKIDYNVGSGGGSSGGSLVSQWVKEIKVSDSEMNLGQVLKQLKTNYRLTFNVKGVGHHVGVKSMTSTTVTIEVASTPQIVTLTLGETKKFDVDNDKYYDLSVTLNSIANGNADITINQINELMPQAQQSAPSTTGQETSSTTDTGSTTTGTKAKESNIWMWVLVIVIVIFIVGFVMSKQGKRKNKQRS
ncbi:MAG: hypothetical protein ABIH28_00850 [archaeon]